MVPTSLEILTLEQDDKPILLDLFDEAGEPVEFDSLEGLRVVVAINRVVVATYDKTPGEGELEVLPVDGEPAACKILLTVAQQASWSTGLLQAQFTLVNTDDDFPDGRHTSRTVDLYYCEKQL